MIRGFAGGVRQFQDKAENSRAIVALGEKHARWALDMVDLGQSYYVEVEFLDEADFSKRFFRFGTDRSAMVQPMGTSFGDMPGAIRKWAEGL
jgi:hypothetical protein